MNHVLVLSQRLIENRSKQSEPVELKRIEHEINEQLNKTQNPSDIIEAIRFDRNHLRLTIDVINNMYNRLIELDCRTPEVLRWYASMLSLYGDLFDDAEVDRLFAEADSLEAR